MSTMTLPSVKLNLDEVYPGCLAVVIVARSGGGKDTMARSLREDIPDKVVQIPSCTTRNERDDDKGKYRYMTDNEFEDHKKRGLFAWTACPYGTAQYGTLMEDLKKHLKPGQLAIIDVELNSAFEVHKQIGHAAYIIYLDVPEEQLLGRLQKRDAALPAEHCQTRINGDKDWPQKIKDSNVFVHIVDNSDGRFEIAKAEIIEALSRPPKYK